MKSVLNKKLIVIGGPTASGKTSLAIQIAQHFYTEIISADSRQCYKELNIGVAKPNDAELALVKHHFINSHSIQQDVTAGDYERYGLATLDTIFKQHDVAVCVGGTGLYIKSLCEGLDDMPPIDIDIKRQVEQDYENQGLTWLQKELKALDPIFLAAADTQNPMRLMRALIFYKSNHQSILQYQGKVKKERPFDIEYYAIDMDRKSLYERINHRVDLMMQQGLLEEVKGVIDFKQNPALQTVGYKELFAYLTGQLTLEQSVDKIKQHTRNYAKRQITWFKNQGKFNILDTDQIVEKIKFTNCR